MRPMAVFVLLCAATAAAQEKPAALEELPPPEISGPDEPAVRIRSEEHTSELQSH